MKRILTRGNYLNTNNLLLTANSDLDRIFEEAPFGNDIPWGDSLVGRLVNSLIRKSKISFNKRRISGLTSRLKSLFDEMMEVSKIEAPANTLNFLAVSSLLGELKKQVNDGEEIPTLISTTEDLIDKVKVYKFDHQQEMISALEEFLEYLKSIKSGSIESQDSIDDEDSLESEEAIIYRNGRLLLQSVVDIHYDIKNNVIRFNSKSSGENINTHFDEERYKKQRTNTEKEILTKIEMANKAVKIYTNSKNKERVNFYKTEISNYQKKLQRIKSGIPAKVGSPSYTTSAVNEEVESNVTEVESDAINSWRRVVRSYEKSGISNHINDIEDLLATNTSKGKEILKSAMITILKISKQVVLNKAGVGKPIEYEELISENSMSGINIQDVSKSISLMGRVILAYKGDMGIIGAYASVTKHIKSFISSFENIENIMSHNVESNESISTYNEFLILLERNQYSDQVKDKFDQIFTEQVTSYFDISDEKKEKIKSEVKERSDYVITNEDYIIEIVRLFHRAWRLHTPGVIPSGRTGGKISNSVFREYEYLGSGSSGSPDSPGPGPYRNIKLHDLWMQSLYDILSDSKYRPLFGEKMTMRFHNEETGQKGDTIKAAGKILLRFINRLASDSVMFSERGAITKFIDEYFKLKVKDENSLDYKGYKDISSNRSSSSGISKTNVKFVPISREKKEEVQRTEDSTFMIETTQTKTKYYFRVLYSDSSNIYVLFSLQGVVYDRTRINVSPVISGSTKFFIGKIQVSDFIDSNTQFSISYIDLSEKDESKWSKNTQTIPFDKISALVEDSGDLYTGLNSFSTLYSRFRGYRIEDWKKITNRL